MTGLGREQEDWPIRRLRLGGDGTLEWPEDESAVPLFHTHVILL